MVWIEVEFDLYAEVGFVDIPLLVWFAARDVVWLFELMVVRMAVVSDGPNF